MKSILLVEDSPEDVFFLQRAFKKAGVTNPLQIAEDGKKAMEYLEGSGAYRDRVAYPLPALVLLDIKLPYVNGLDVLAWIRARTELARMVVIIFTSSAVDSDVSNAYSLGANSYSIKPTSSDKLSEFTKALQEYWLQHDRACVASMG
jgi:CheY-like chemotaxis protein